MSNITENGEAIGIADAGMLWHTDGSYLKTPDLYTVLYGIQIPERDGRALGDAAGGRTRDLRRRGGIGDGDRSGVDDRAPGTVAVLHA